MQSNAEAHWKTTMHAKELPPMYFCNLSLLHSLCVCVGALDMLSLSMCQGC